MGCGSSQAVSVIPVGEASNRLNTLESIQNIKSLNSKPVLKPIPRKNEDTTKDSSERMNSASSNDSGHDSGYADNEYKNIITENSDPELVKRIEKEFTERNLGMLIKFIGLLKNQ